MASGREVLAREVRRVAGRRPLRIRRVRCDLCPLGLCPSLAETAAHFCAVVILERERQQLNRTIGGL